MEPEVHVGAASRVPNVMRMPSPTFLIERFQYTDGSEPDGENRFGPDPVVPFVMFK